MIFNGAAKYRFKNLPRKRKKAYKKFYIKKARLYEKSPYQHLFKYCFYYDDDGNEVKCTTTYSEEEYNRRSREDDW